MVMVVIVRMMKEWKMMMMIVEEVLCMDRKKYDKCSCILNLCGNCLVFV